LLIQLVAGCKLATEMKSELSPVENGYETAFLKYTVLSYIAEGLQPFTCTHLFQLQGFGSKLIVQINLSAATV